MTVLMLNNVTLGVLIFTFNGLGVEIFQQIWAFEPHGLNAHLKNMHRILRPELEDCQLKAHVKLPLRGTEAKLFLSCHTSFTQSAK